MVQVGDSNSIQVSQTDVGEENLEEEEIETPNVEEPTPAAGSQLGTPQDTSNDQNNDRPVDMQQFEEDCATAAPPEHDGPPDIRQVESGAEVEDNTAEKPPVSSNTEEKTVSDGPGPEEQPSSREGVHVNHGL
ncbi:uncharacterized protein [Branchiostoma lanceolatum]|uniref:uncharacterized protein n=1 Tax=Branchiostoma lanceolatum TaxID=7740 RepID=UPI00345565FD